MLEGLICPVCENTIEEIDLKDSLKCPHCATDLKNRKYLDFLEFLMSNGIVDILDFFDPEVYSDDVDDLDLTKEEEGDPSEFEKKKDLFNIRFKKINGQVENSAQYNLIKKNIARLFSTLKESK